jgi:hypothetical protein
MNHKSDTNFDLPYHNPFQKTNESDAHFRFRCDKTTAPLKKDYRKIVGCYYVDACTSRDVNDSNSNKVRARAQSKHFTDGRK